MRYSTYDKRDKASSVYDRPRYGTICISPSCSPSLPPSPPSSPASSPMRAQMTIPHKPTLRILQPHVSREGGREGGREGKSRGK